MGSLLERLAIDKGVEGWDYVERKDSVITPIMTTGIRNETLRDVLTDEKTAITNRQSYDPRNLSGAN